MNSLDTIYSLVTAPINQNIAVIRISGEEAFSITSKLSNIKAKDVRPNSVVNRNIIVDSEKLDNVLFLYFQNPRSFTGEDVVEIQTHGSMFVVSKVLKWLELNGARQAEPGEFTRRSYLNNKIDLVQAESINNLIFSKTKKTQELSSSQLMGESSDFIRNLKEKLLTLIAEIEVSVDYPEFDETRATTNLSTKKRLTAIKDEMIHIYRESNIVSTLTDGIKVAIVGKPNVGKSSILNTLLNEEKAIVFDMPGTTRDIVEGEFYLNGLLYRMIDTAGIRKADTKIEELGIIKSLENIENADIVITVLDSSNKLDDEDKLVLDKVKDKNTIYVYNKNDLQRKLDLDVEHVEVSAINSDIKNLVKAIKVRSKDLAPSVSNQVLVGERQITLMDKGIKILESVIEDINDETVMDLLSEDIKDIYNVFNEILGEKVDENLLDKIFSKFCLGK